MTRYLKYTLAALALATTGCSAVSVLEDASRPLEIYELRTPQVSIANARRNVELVVEEPVASGALAVERIMIKPAPLRAQYLPDVRWSDTAPVMLQTLLVRSLTESGAVASVGRRPVGTIGDYALLTELTEFQAEARDGSRGADIRVGMTFRIVRERDSAVLATRAFAVTEASPDTGSDSVVAAFDRATAGLLASALPWIVQQIR